MVESNTPVGIPMERVGVAIFASLYGMAFRTELSWSLSDVFEFRRLSPIMQGTLVAEGSMQVLAVIDTELSL